MALWRRKLNHTVPISKFIDSILGLTWRSKAINLFNILIQ